MELQNAVVVITGASKGLGREIALRLCRHRTNLVLIARTRDLLEQVQKQILDVSGRKPLIISCDISNEADVEQMAAIISRSFVRVDVLINNAAVGIHKLSGEMSNGEMRKQFEVNFFGSFYCIKALLPLLELSDSAYILNVNSIVSRLAFADNSIYAATKSALVRFSEGLRHELRKSSVRVGSLFPCLMRTSFQNDRKIGDESPSFMFIGPEKVAAQMEKMIIRRKKNVYVRRWTSIILMTIKRVLG